MKPPVLAAAVASAALFAAAVPAHAAPYAIDPTHTFVTFEVVHFGTSTNRGRFDKKEGSVQFDRATRAGKVEIRIDMASIDTGVGPFDEHLRGKDFFDAAKFPTATFVADRMTFAGDKVAEVPGALTMLGKTVPVTLKATNFNCYDNPIFKREVCGGDFETTIKRSQWGMSWGLDMGIPDDVRLLIQVEAVRQ
ncbi:MAG: polyisoprenoid-binding protein [Rubrivivax sp.]|nr:polyisoprenoid-binding protein [Rubrivivax sp.]